MSGGVDSSVVAAKLKSEGFDVIGITLQLYDHGQAIGKTGTCCAGIDINDARRIADKLKFPHYVLNYESRFKESVIDEFAESYLNGNTPVPCIRCNEKIKFTDLMKTAKELKADCLATGHYVRQCFGSNGPELHKATDLKKDQSYFLFATTSDQLSFLRFPLGELESKDKTRQLAEKLKLKVANKPDSQDICFVPNGSYTEVIRKLRPDSNKPGNIQNMAGEVIGRHNGVINFTIGQRRGLRIGGGNPLYVTKIDALNQIITVGPKEALIIRSISINEINWLGSKNFLQAPTNGWEVEVKVRSTKPAVPALVKPISRTEADVVLSCDEQGISPGQACVFYQNGNSRVLGGGWIILKK
ncbi:MAG: tRNA 2-thiouridine(34) synthase MnmA [Rhodobacteraceae bacterium]|nr:MAG: tRNA 2-thiouridine(34) synthase MnmA [Paracoccaceae bacterium]